MALENSIDKLAGRWFFLQLERKIYPHTKKELPGFQIQVPVCTSTTGLLLNQIFKNSRFLGSKLIILDPSLYQIHLFDAEILTPIWKAIFKKVV
jgi:hypothetical protein